MSLRAITAYLAIARSHVGPHPIHFQTLLSEEAA